MPTLNSHPKALFFEHLNSPFSLSNKLKYKFDKSPKIFLRFMLINKSTSQILRNHFVGFARTYKCYHIRLKMSYLYEYNKGITWFGMDPNLVEPFFRFLRPYVVQIEVSSSIVGEFSMIPIVENVKDFIDLILLRYHKLYPSLIQQCAYKLRTLNCTAITTHNLPEEIQLNLLKLKIVNEEENAQTTRVKFKTITSPISKKYYNTIFRLNNADLMVNFDKIFQHKIQQLDLGQINTDMFDEYIQKYKNAEFRYGEMKELICNVSFKREIEMFAKFFDWFHLKMPSLKSVKLNFNLYGTGMGVVTIDYICTLLTELCEVILDLQKNIDTYTLNVHFDEVLTIKANENLDNLISLLNTNDVLAQFDIRNEQIPGNMTLKLSKISGTLESNIRLKLSGL